MLRRAPALGAALLLAAAPAWAPPHTLGQVTFRSCELASPAGALPAECATLEVPEDPAHPEGRRVALALALLPARAHRAEPDPVLFLAGGPGQSALTAFPQVAPAFEPLRRHRDLLLVDQRGTGRSNGLKCPFGDWKDPAQQTAAAARAQARDCLARVAMHADVRFYTTSDAVRDLEAVRQALGAPRFDLVGVSYGTRVALEYLRRHRDAVRAVVLDSVVPPELPLLQDHAQNLDDALAKIFAACRDDAACGQRFGDPGRTLARLRERLRRAPAPARIHDPLTNAPLDEQLTDTLLGGILRLYAYQSEASALLPLLIDEAARGRPEPLLAQAEIVFQHLNEEIWHGMELSVVCSEDVPFLTPRPSDRDTLMGTALTELAREQCAAWPRGAVPPDFKLPVTSDAPVLVLAGELDPVTPPRYGIGVMRTLSRSRMVVARGQGHAVMQRGCLPKLVARFVERADPDAFDGSCAQAIGPMPAFTSYQGPEP